MNLTKKYGLLVFGALTSVFLMVMVVFGMVSLYGAVAEGVVNSASYTNLFGTDHNVEAVQVEMEPFKATLSQPQRNSNEAVDTGSASVVTESADASVAASVEAGGTIVTAPQPNADSSVSADVEALAGVVAELAEAVAQQGSQGSVVESNPQGLPASTAPYVQLRPATEFPERPLEDPVFLPADESMAALGFSVIPGASRVLTAQEAAAIANRPLPIMGGDDLNVMGREWVACEWDAPFGLAIALMESDVAEATDCTEFALAPHSSVTVVLSYGTYAFPKGETGLWYEFNTMDYLRCNFEEGGDCTSFHPFVGWWMSGIHREGWVDVTYVYPDNTVRQCTGVAFEVADDSLVSEIHVTFYNLGDEWITWGQGGAGPEILPELQELWGVDYAMSPPCTPYSEVWTPEGVEYPTELPN